MSSFAKILSFATLVFCFASSESHALTLGQAAQVAQTATPAAFNSVELIAPAAVTAQVPQFKKATNALEKDIAVLDSCLQNPNSCQGTAMQSWRNLVVSLKNQDQATQLSQTNNFFNNWAYVSDQENYGVSEYWASPVEFMQKSGDCEDYAIAKYVTLKFLGFTDGAMRIMAVLDNNRGGQGHAVLSVATANGKMILDNQVGQIYSETQQVGYTPRFAVNETGVYTYAVQPQMVMASAE